MGGPGVSASLNAADTSCRMRPRTDSSVMVIRGPTGPLSPTSDMGKSPARLLTTKKQGYDQTTAGQALSDG